MNFHPMQRTLRVEILLRWSKLFVFSILVSALLVHSTSGKSLAPRTSGSGKPFVPLVQREDIRISEDLRKKILTKCNEYLEKNKEHKPKIDGVPCHSKDIPLSEIAPELVTQLYTEIETNIKKPLIKELKKKCRENPDYGAALLLAIEKHYHFDNTIANTFKSEDIELEFPDIGFRCIPIQKTLSHLLNGTADSEWIRVDEGMAYMEEDRSKAVASHKFMVTCKMYSAEHEHGCIGHRDLVTYRTNKQNIPLVLSVSIFEPEGDVESLRYEEDHYSGSLLVTADKMVPIKREPGQATLIPPGVGHDVVPPKTGYRISMIVVGELMAPAGQKKFQEDKVVQNVPVLLRNLAKDIAGRAVEKSETDHELMGRFVNGLIEDAEARTSPDAPKDDIPKGVPEEEQELEKLYQIGCAAQTTAELSCES